MSFFVCVRRGLQQKQNDALAILFLAAWPLVFFWQAALRQAVFFFGDILLFFHPTHLAYADALRSGRLPLWEPRMLAGFPLFAEGQIGALYPPHLLLYGLLPIDVATNYDILLHLAWVCIGTYLFARTLPLRPASALLGAFAFGSGGFFIPRLQHMSILTAAAWLPWLLWACEMYRMETAPSKRRRWWVLLVLMSALQLLGGHPQFAFLSMLLLALNSFVRWKRDESAQIGQRWIVRYFDPRTGFLVMLGVLVGAALAAPQLLPTFELSALSSRAAGLLPKYFTAFSLRPVHYLMLLHPFLLGNPLPFVSVEVIGYIGLLPFALAIGAPLVHRDRRVVFFGLVALLALFLGMGDQNVVYRNLRVLPLFSYFRVPSRFLFWYTFAAAILAAMTFDYLLGRAQVTARLSRAQKIMLALIAVLLALVVGLVPALPVEAWLSAWVWLPLVFACVGAWIVCGAWRGLFAHTTLAALVLGMTVFDLALFASVYAKTYDAVIPVAEFSKPPGTLSVLRNLSPQDGRVMTSLWIYPVPQTMRASLYPNISLTFGVPSALGYSPLLPQRISDYLDLEHLVERVSAPMVNLLNVRYYLIPQLLPVDASTEGDDLRNPFISDPVNRFLAIPPTRATSLKITSSLAQSVALRDGDEAARIVLVTRDGSRLTFPLRAGIETAEWAYERSDVRQVIQHAMPPIATTFPAASAFPTEEHPGHTYLAQFDLTRSGEPLEITGITILPTIPSGLLHVERISFISADGKENSLARFIGRSDQTLIYRTNQVAVFENYDALPRAFLVHEAHLADDQTALKELTGDDFRPLETLILAEGSLMRQGAAQLPDESVRILTYLPERVVLSVRASMDGYLLLADSWYPGWIARVDGAEVPIRRADLVFRAVPVGQGSHQVEFEYRPSSLFMGGVIGLLALVLLSGVALSSRR